MPGSVLPEWMQWLQAIGVLVIALAGTVIAGLSAAAAWQQKDINRQQADTAKQQMVLAQRKLQHDLFDRRFAVFEAARLFLATMLTQAQTSREQERAFLLTTGDAQFLFDDGIHAYFEEWRSKASAIRRIELRLENLVGEDQRRPLVDEKGEIFDYFERQADGADGVQGLIERFRPYLSLRHE